MLYRVRKSWDNPKSQIGAFNILQNAISVCDEGYFVFDEDGNVVYPEVKAPEGKQMDLYSFNKMIIAQMPDLDEKGIKSGKEKIHKFVSDLNKEYFMLLCADLVYYTMFIMDSFSVENTADVVIECLENLGKIKSIDFTEGKQAIEIWIQKDEEVVVAYFFNYDQGVIKCKR